MSNVSIYEKSWIDLVFEDKNKAYGAYQLRQENPKTSLLAMLGGVLFFISVFGLGLLLSSFGKKPEETVITCILPSIHPTTIKPEVIKPKSQHTQPVQPKDPINLSHAVVAITSQAVDVPKNEDQKPFTNIAPGSQGDGKGIPNSGGNVSSTDVSTPTVPIDVNPVTTNLLDKLPEYPGGIKEFYSYVSRNIDRPEIDDHTDVHAMNVIMSFVIETDGSLTDIRALRSSDKELEKAAIKVLKALKIKWTPGLINGQKVRTQYMLPIRVGL